jgi:hypothetical protein
VLLALVSDICGVLVSPLVPGSGGSQLALTKPVSGLCSQPAGTTTYIQNVYYYYAGLFFISFC